MLSNIHTGDRAVQLFDLKKDGKIIMTLHCQMCVSEPLGRSLKCFVNAKHQRNCTKISFITLAQNNGISFRNKDTLFSSYIFVL
jgi:hypothetical protein